MAIGASAIIFMTQLRKFVGREFLHVPSPSLKMGREFLPFPPQDLRPFVI